MSNETKSRSDGTAENRPREQGELPPSALLRQDSSPGKRRDATRHPDLAAIRFFHDKMGYTRYHLPSNDPLGVELERWRFGGVDRTWSGAEFHRMIGKAMAEHRDAVAGEWREANLTFHGLRHSYAVAALQAGDDIKTVQGNLGHHTASFTLDVYGHVTEQMKQASAVRMEAFIQSVSGQ